MTELIERYRLNAEKCLRLAESFKDLEAKRALIAMANAWIMLAVQREKNIETASAQQPPSRGHEPPTPNEPPAPSPLDEPPKPPVSPPPTTEPPPLRLKPDKPNGPMQC